MHAVKLGRQDDMSSGSTRNIYQEIRLSLRRTARIEGLQCFSIRPGVAVLNHLVGEGEAEETWEEALKLECTKSLWYQSRLYRCNRILYKRPSGENGDIVES